MRRQARRSTAGRPARTGSPAARTLLPASRCPARWPPVPGVTYVASLDVGVVNDRTVLAVMHVKETGGLRAWAVLPVMASVR
jgi:hypothetical protein